MRNHKHEMLTTSEAAEILACSNSTARRMLDSGILNGYRIPGSTHRRVARAEVERLRAALVRIPASEIARRMAVLETPEQSAPTEA